MGQKNTCLLLILDGWGANSSSHGNAIALTPTPNWDSLLSQHPHRLLLTHGEDSGLPAGQMGNSEVGHTNIGAGRVVYQSLTRIDKAIADGELQRLSVWRQALQQLQARRGTLHLIGLLSDGGVHSHQQHIFAACQLAFDAGQEVKLHLILDGRDTEPQSAGAYLEALHEFIRAKPRISIASVCGRYYAMDRDNRWQRTELAYQAIVDGKAGFQASSAEAALQAAYARGESDEFVQPTIIGNPSAVQAQDTVLAINFRADRMRQLCSSLTTGTASFTRRLVLAPEQLVTMTDYGAGIQAQVLFPRQELVNGLGEWLSLQGKTQLRLAETEKFPHVSYFFSGGREAEYAGEQRILVPSPKVATYDLQPQMSADAVVDQLCAALDAREFDFIVCNIANGDMVGHTGSLDAACQAVACVDVNLGRIMTSLQANQAQALISADHGNCEQMYVGASTEPHTAHTTHPVEICYFGAQQVRFRSGPARLADIAPTVLKLMDLPQPEQMSGHSLV